MGFLDRLMSPEDPDGIKTFVYEAVSGSGERVKSRMTALNERAVANALQAEGWLPVDIRPEGGGLSFDVGAAWENRPLKLDTAQSSEFARQLYQLLDAGISAPRAFAALGEDADPRVTAVCDDVSSRVSAGQTVSDALGAHPKAFDDIFRAYVRSGETSGTLELTVGRLADMLGKRAAMRNKIKGVTAYPKAVAIAIGLIVTGILKFMVPVFANMYGEFGAELPAPTRMVVALSNRLPLALLFVVAVALGVREFVQRRGDEPEWSVRIDRFKYKRLPVFKELNHKTALYRWASTLGGGMDAGVNVYESLTLASDASGSRWIRVVTPELTKAVREGRRMTEEMRETSELFPANIRTMISTGEETGDIPAMLSSVTQSLDSDIDRIVATLGAKIEVALLIVLGTVVGGLLAVLYLPILNLANTVMQGLS